MNVANVTIDQKQTFPMFQFADIRPFGVAIGRSVKDNPAPHYVNSYGLELVRFQSRRVGLAFLGNTVIREITRSVITNLQIN